MAPLAIGIGIGVSFEAANAGGSSTTSDIQLEASLDHILLEGGSGVVELESGPAPLPFTAAALAISGLVGYWPLSETSGSVAYNLQGNGALNGTYSAVSLAADNLVPNGQYANFNGSTSYVNIFSSALASAFNGAEGTLICYVQPTVGAWVDGVFRRGVIIRHDVNNRVSIHKDSTNDQFDFLYVAGGTSLEGTYTLPVAVPANFPLLLASFTWSKSNNQVLCYLADVQQGSTLTGLGTFAGAIADAEIGSDSLTPTLPWSGGIGPTLLYNRALTQLEIRSLSETFLQGAGPLVKAVNQTPVSTLRSTLIGEIWSGFGLPSTGVDSVATNVTNPLAAGGFTPSNLLRVDQLTFNMDDNQGNFVTAQTPYVFYPTSGTSNGNLVIYNTGHTSDNNAWPLGNQGVSVQSLVQAGYTVIGLFMPFGGDDATTITNHDARPAPTATLNSLKFYIEPIVRSINYLGSGFGKICMAGLSGGGWTVSVAAAVDTRIARSAHVAGSLPLYMTNFGSGVRDWEQWLPGVWPTMDYQDLYVMACDGGRKQTQILNSNDPSDAAYTTYQLYTPYVIPVTAAALGAGGTWAMYVSTSSQHTITSDSLAVIEALFAS